MLESGLCRCKIKIHLSHRIILLKIQRILAQGHFDGLCLIYSLFNAYKALRNPDEKASNFAERNSNPWRRVIGNTPSLHNFVLGEGSDFGELKDMTDAKIKQAFIATCFEVMTDKSRVSSVVTAVDIQSLATMNFSETVAILCVTKNAEFELGGMGDHWVAIVGRDDEQKKYLVACSNTMHQYGFNERQDVQTGRFYNTTIDVEGINKRTAYLNNINQVKILQAKTNTAKR